MKNLTKTQVLNTVYNLVCLLAALGSELGDIPFVPEKYKHYVSSAAMAAMWVKSHWNLFLDPATGARLSAVPPAEQPQPPQPPTAK